VIFNLWKYKAQITVYIISYIMIYLNRVHQNKLLKMK